jgi:20S proteasome subunit beta 7
MDFQTYKIFHEDAPKNKNPLLEQPSLAKTHTTDPIVTGTSVLAMKYNGGVAIAADTLASYGSMARFRNIERLKAFGGSTIVGASGEISDFQYIEEQIQHQLIDRDYQLDDGSHTTPKEIFQYLVRVLYNRRNKFDPLYNVLVVAGYRNGKAFLGQTDYLGTHFEDTTIATGYGAYIAQPILRKFVQDKGGYENISEQEAVNVLRKCLEVLFYRDARAADKVQIAVVNDQGPTINPPEVLDTKWTFKGF